MVIGTSSQVRRYARRSIGSDVPTMSYADASSDSRGGRTRRTARRGTRTGAFVLRMSLDPPWSMRIQDDAPLTLICVTHGSAVIVTESGRAHRLRSGDVAVARGVEHYLFAD